MRKVNEIENITEYNQKIDARFIRYLSDGKPFSYEDTKDENSRFQSLLKAFLVFKKAPITETSLNDMYQALTSKNIVISEAFIEKTLKIKTISEMITCFVEIVQSELFLDQTEEMAKLIFNCLLISQEYCPVIFYPSISKQIIKAIIDDAEAHRLELLFFHAYMNTVNKLNRKQKVKTQDEVIQMMQAHQEMLKDLYGITSIGLFGSFARGDQHAYSDMDIWIKSDRLISYKDKFLIKSLLETMLDAHVDLNIWTKNVAETVFHDNLTVF
ncbi:nucleotidyltransferase domain-containing protein [Acholeplasma equirhinis]|uniref:nucleotidyltransferase family protein n=1 Tax=Acholeplasma equirhinis TaxID=555393 RepID=UPI00197AD039|nr:nucleotidyltransferase domain-containing protein [Acholeplasma equirhinis]MBN3490240.1 nucleotidyltransferase domain-containing protein [Acholeplasma equirhinis]